MTGVFEDKGLSRATRLVLVHAGVRSILDRADALDVDPVRIAARIHMTTDRVEAALRAAAETGWLRGDQARWPADHPRRR
jgi:hypothetical protein